MNKIEINEGDKVVTCNACGYPVPEQNVYYGKTLTICDNCVEDPCVEEDLVNDGDPNETEDET